MISIECKKCADDAFQVFRNYFQKLERYLGDVEVNITSSSKYMRKLLKVVIPQKVSATFFPEYFEYLRNEDKALLL